MVTSTLALSSTNFHLVKRLNWVRFELPFNGSYPNSRSSSSISVPGGVNNSNTSGCNTTRYYLGLSGLAGEENTGVRSMLRHEAAHKDRMCAWPACSPCSASLFERRS
jgi:hypothetical protein